MGMLPFAMRNVAELTVWSLLLMYIMARSVGLDTTIVSQLSAEKAQSYLQVLMDSPDCFAYNPTQVIEQKNSNNQVTSVSITNHPSFGVVDISKFYDLRHQNCLRKSEVWDNYVQVGKACGWALLSFLDPRDDCTGTQKCVNHQCIDPSQGNMKAATGSFITYNITLTDQKNGNVYDIASFEQGSKLAYLPLLNNPQYSQEDWANQFYPEYMTCQSNFGGVPVKAQSPVLIAYPNKNGGATEDLGTMSISMCLGVYGKPTIACYNPTLNSLVSNTGQLLGQNCYII